VRVFAIVKRLTVSTSQPVPCPGYWQPRSPGGMLAFGGRGQTHRAAPNNSFKPKPLRSGKNMAEKACHVFTSTTRFGLTQALGATVSSIATEFEQFFSPLSRTISAFAADHGLALEKYYHDAPTWSLGFGHPLGGQAKIDVSRLDDLRVQVQAIWWLDDYRTFTRSLKWGGKSVAAPNPSVVSGMLSDALGECLSWSQPDRTDIASGYEPFWSSMSEGEFNAMANRWPPLRDSGVRP